MATDVILNLRRMDKDLWRRVKSQAAREGITLSDLGQKLFNEYLQRNPENGTHRKNQND